MLVVVDGGGGGGREGVLVGTEGIALPGHERLRKTQLKSEQRCTFLETRLPPPPHPLKKTNTSKQSLNAYWFSDSVDNSHPWIECKGTHYHDGYQVTTGSCATRVAIELVQKQHTDQHHDQGGQAIRHRQVENGKYLKRKTLTELYPHNRLCFIPQMSVSISITISIPHRYVTRPSQKKVRREKKDGKELIISYSSPFLASLFYSLLRWPFT